MRNKARASSVDQVDGEAAALLQACLENARAILIIAYYSGDESSGRAESSTEYVTSGDKAARESARNTVAISPVSAGRTRATLSPLLYFTLIFYSTPTPLPVSSPSHSLFLFLSSFLPPSFFPSFFLILFFFHSASLFLVYLLTYGTGKLNRNATRVLTFYSPGTIDCYRYDTGNILLHEQQRDLEALTADSYRSAVAITLLTSCDLPVSRRKTVSLATTPRIGLYPHADDVGVVSEVILLKKRSSA